MTFTAIKPKGFNQPDRGKLQAELERFARGVADDVKRYPPWRPWKNPPKSGPHAGGRRTGDLGSSWQYKVSVGGNSGYAEVRSSGVRYAKYVQGGRQTSVMAGRGWRRATDIGKDHRAEFHERMQQWAKVTRK